MLLRKFLIIFLLFNNYCFAQSDTINYYKTTFTFNPLMWFANGANIQVNIVNGPRSALNFDATMFTGTINNNGDRNVTLTNYNQNSDARRAVDKINGFGFGFAYKYYFYMNEYSKGAERFYGSLGYQFHSNKITFNDYDYYSFRQDGVLFYSYDLIELRGNVIQQGINVLVGAEKIESGFTFGLSAGLGYRTSAQSEKVKQFRNYKSNFFDFAYEGFLPVIMLNFGISIK